MRSARPGAGGGRGRWAPSAERDRIPDELHRLVKGLEGLWRRLDERRKHRGHHPVELARLRVIEQIAAGVSEVRHGFVVGEDKDAGASGHDLLTARPDRLAALVDALVEMQIRARALTEREGGEGVFPYLGPRVGGGGSEPSAGPAGLGGAALSCHGGLRCLGANRRAVCPGAVTSSSGRPEGRRELLAPGRSRASSAGGDGPCPGRRGKLRVDALGVAGLSVDANVAARVSPVGRRLQVGEGEIAVPRAGEGRAARGRALLRA